LRCEEQRLVAVPGHMFQKAAQRPYDAINFGEEGFGE
jgi:hypothetical protein